MFTFSSVLKEISGLRDTKVDCIMKWPLKWATKWYSCLFKLCIEVGQRVSGWVVPEQLSSERKIGVCVPVCIQMQREKIWIAFKTQLEF